MYNGNENNVSEIMNSSDKMNILIDALVSSMNKFKDQRQYTIFVYLAGYFTAKNNNIYSKEKIQEILNTFLENGSSNNGNDVIKNLSNIFDLYNEVPKEDMLKSNIINNNQNKSLNSSNYNIMNSNDVININYSLDNSNNINNINNNLENSNNINNIIKNSQEVLRAKNDNRNIKNLDNNTDNNANNQNKSNINEKKEDEKEDEKIESKIDNSLNSINNINTNSIKNNQNNLEFSKSFPKKMKKCEICLEEFNEYDSLNYELKCGCIIHNNCFDDYIKNAVENNKIPILCPNCKAEIHPNLIYDSLISNNQTDLIKKFEKFSMDHYLLNHKDSYSCCPTPGCEYTFFFENENHFICPQCHKNYCLFCKNEWHEGMTCQEYMDSKDVNKLDQKFKEFVQGQNYKICPKCGIWVEKVFGCNHMRCMCGADFCYRCGKIIPQGLHDCPCWNNDNYYENGNFYGNMGNEFRPHGPHGPHGFDNFPPRRPRFDFQPPHFNNMDYNNNGNFGGFYGDYNAQFYGNNNFNRGFFGYNNRGPFYGGINDQGNMNNFINNQNNQGQFYGENNNYQ